VLDRTWLLGVARREREALGRAIQYTDPGAWGNPSAWRGRAIADVLAHLTATDQAAAAVFGEEPAAEVEEYRQTLADERDFSFTGFRDWSVVRRAEQPVHALAREWGKAADLLISRATEVADEAWHDREVDWFGEPLRAGYLVQHRVCQWWVHGQDIRQGGGQAFRREHDPTWVVNDFAIQLIPYALSLEGHAFPGMSVRVDLEEVGEGKWHKSLDGPQPPPEGKKPDVTIEGRGSWFALLASNRADADTALYEGVLVYGGNVTAGEAVLRTLRAFP